MRPVVSFRRPHPSRVGHRRGDPRWRAPEGPGRPPGRVIADRASSRGQVVPLIAVVLLLAALVGVGLVHVGAAAARQSLAQAAADAAALAGAEQGREAAAGLAAANGAELVGYREEVVALDAVDVEVVVRRRGHTARARARWTPTPVAPGPADGPAPPGAASATERPGG